MGVNMDLVFLGRTSPAEPLNLVIYGIARSDRLILKSAWLKYLHVSDMLKGKRNM